ncbi:MAG TPA: hypothetical protein VK492_08725 [Chitinophagaceae bacterium]|nr:hypothetical protein [Chitinophagaceae bacterium]
MQSTLYKRHFFVFMICLSFALSAFCQHDLNEIQSSFNEYKNYSLREKIFTHTDKDLYVAGDIVWFKLYVVNADDNKLIDLSKLAYVEILNADQKPIVQTKVQLDKGVGNGSLYLPVSLNSGVYKFRAYTNWMKNFDAAYFFEKSITIINTLKTLKIEEPISNFYDVQFFPEGGNLVQTIQSRVAFKITDRTGKGINCKGFLVRNNNDTITEFQPLKFGIGNFSFTPETGSTYKAVIKLADTTITKELPKALENGYVLKVNDVNGSQLNVHIATSNKSDFVYVFVHTRQNPVVAGKVFLKNGEAELLIEKNKLGEGISHITVFNRDILPVCERLIFIRPTQKIIIQSKIDEDQYPSRKQVRINLNSTDESGKLIPIDLSVAVYRLDSLEAFQGSMIDNYFWLTYELKGTIESPEYYFSEIGAEADQAIDNLMLTHGWRRFQWQNVLQRTRSNYSSVPEYKGHIINGRVTNKTSGIPVSGVLTYLSVPGSRVQLYSSRSDSNGVVRFYTKDFYGPNEIVLQTQSDENAGYNVEIINPFADKFSQESLPPFHIQDSMKNLLTDYSTSMQVQNNFNGGKLKEFYAPIIDSSAFYGVPDKQYKLDDYTRFSTMEEVLREYVYEVLVRRQKENFHLIMADGDNKIFLDDPFTLINGVPVLDPNKIMKYDPLKVKEIDVVKSRHFWGPLILNGIVNLVTYEPDPSIITDLNAVILGYDGLQYQREFYSPVYESQEQLSSRMPDFRSVLYWSPNIHTDSQGKTEINFFTSDMKGKYIVILQGIDADGRVGKNIVSFEVK